MHIERLWMNNPLRNFNYIVACLKSNDALVIDPLDAKRCFEVAEANNWKIKQILNTHEHHDHIEGNDELKQLSGAKILAHHQAHINKDISLKENDIVTVGEDIHFQVLDTPGHTMTHICLYKNNAPDFQQPILFCGDTLFNAGIGHCRLGGEPNELFATVQKLLQLPANTRLYPGHDYLINNLEFTLDREPGNKIASQMLDKYRNQDPNKATIMTLDEEKKFNVFFRLDSPEIIDKLVREHNIDKEFLKNDPKQVFLKLRQLRNHW